LSASTGNLKPLTCAPWRVQQVPKRFWLELNTQAVWSTVTVKEDQKAVRQLDGLFFQGRIVPTEVQKTIRTFWKKSYGRLKGSVKEFFQNKCLSFQ
jgi:hypothetical protein